MSSNKSRKRGSARSQSSTSGSGSQAQAGSARSGAYVPAQLDKERTGVGSILLLASGVAGVLLALYIGLTLFAPGMLPSFLQGGPQPTATSVTSSTVPPQDRLSFVRTSDQSTSRDLYVVNADGTKQQQVTHDIVVGGTTEWAPDAKSILMQATINGTETIVRLSIDADNKPGESAQLTADVKADSAFPSWSPDGTMIAFQSKREGGDYQVFVMDANGSNKRRISDGKGFAGQPDWSPDGKSLVYIEGANTNTGTPAELYIAPVSGGAPRQVSKLGQVLRRPRWLAGGKSFVVMSGGERSVAILLIGQDGTITRTLVPAGPNAGAEVSPTGDRVAYYSVTPESGSKVQLVQVSGGTPGTLSSGAQEDYWPVWSPDGKRLAWASVRNGTFKIVTANADGTDLKAVSSGDGRDYQPAWGVATR